MPTTRGMSSSQSAEEATTSGRGRSSRSAQERTDRSQKSKKSTTDLVVGRCYPSHLHTTMCVEKLPKTVGKFQTTGPALREVMSPEQMALLKTTPFYSYLDLPPLKQDLVLVDSLLSFWNEERRGIRIGESFIPLIPDEISILVGLPAQGEPIEWHEGSVKSSTLDKHFNGDYRDADRSKLRHLLYGIAGQSGEEMAVDFVRIFILYVFVTVLFPNSHYIVPKALYRYIDDVYRIGEYAWGHAVYNYLVSAISKASPRVKRRISGQERRAGYIDGCTVALLSWAYEHVKGLGVSDGDKSVPRMRKWKGSIAYRSYEKLMKKLQSYSPAKVVTTFTYRPEEMSILNRALRGSLPEQAAAPMATAADPVVGEISNLRSLLNKLESEFNKVEARNKFLEMENAQLKEINAKLRQELSSGTATAAAEGGAGDSAGMGERSVDQPEGGEGTAVEERDIPSRIDRIKGRQRKRKELSPSFTPGERRVTRLYSRKERRPLKTEVVEEGKAADDNVSGTIAEVLMGLQSDLGQSRGDDQPVDVDDVPGQTELPGFISERRRKYPGIDHISKYERDSINFLLFRPITRGPIWQDDTKGSDSPSVSGELLLEHLFGGPTSDEVINVYFHILDKMDSGGVQKFSEPGIFCRSEVVMHILNKMQGIGKDDALTADFVRDVAFGSASIRHFLEKINSHTCSKSRFLLFPVHSNWHWHLLSYDLKEGRFESWNSLSTHTGAKDAANLVAKWFASYLEHILQIRVGAPDVVFRLDCQQQGATVDCGMYTCLFAERLVRNEQADLVLYDSEPRCFRSHMASVILNDPCCVTYNSMIESAVPKDD